MQVLTTDFSARAAAAVMNRLAKLSARFIGEQGFSIGIDDVTPAHELQASTSSTEPLRVHNLHSEELPPSLNFVEVA